jgi:hypothetical protein
LYDSAKRNATDSPLLRIPPEIWNKIWELAMGHQLIKAPGGRNGDTSSTRSKTGSAILRPINEVEWERIVFPWTVDVYPRDSTTKRVSAFHLPEVCRQIYSETAVLGCKLNTFVITTSHLNYKNWAIGLLPVYRRAIQSIEPDTEYLATLVDGFARPLKLRVFPGLTTIIVSDIALDCLLHKYKRKYPGYTTDDWKSLVERKIHENHGQDLEVIFEQADNVAG